MRYPFMRHAKSIAPLRDYPFEEILKRDKEISKRVLRLFKMACSVKKVEPFFVEDITNIYVHAFTRLMLSLIDNKRMNHRIANALSKFYGVLLRTELIDVLIAMLSEFGLDFEYSVTSWGINAGKVRLDCRIPYLQYLRVAVQFKTEAWKLVNQIVNQGYVYLPSTHLPRITEEMLKLKFTDVPKLNVKEKALILQGKQTKLLFDRIDKHVKKLFSAIPKVDGIIDKNEYPLCILRVMSRLEIGINLAHQERLFISFFLMNAGEDIEHIVSLFRGQPDFSEEITRKQLAQMVTSEGAPKYFPHNCMKLMSLQICPQTHKCHEYSNNPLVLYRKRLEQKYKKPELSKGGYVKS
jgi:DNA primase large subunit